MYVTSWFVDVTRGIPEPPMPPPQPPPVGGIYREVTLSMPLLWSSKVQLVKMVPNSMLPLFQSFPEAFSRWRANSPKREFSWSEDCREHGQRSE